MDFGVGISKCKYYDREVTEYAPDDIDFNRIWRVNNNLWFLYSGTNQLELNNNFMVWSIHALYWFTYLALLISSALKSHFSTRNWQIENEYKN